MLRRLQGAHRLARDDIRVEALQLFGWQAADAIALDHGDHVEDAEQTVAQGVKVVVTAEQEIVSITIAPEVPRENIPALTIDALNRALKKAQIVSAEKMQGIMGQMGLGAPQG